MNPVLEEIITKGITRTVSGEEIKVVGQISDSEGRLIQKCINEIGAEVSVEIGLAFGTSALYICEALKKTANTRHYISDPYQMHAQSYGGIGLNNLKKSGFEHYVMFMEKPSHQALAELEQDNVKADFAFIDGWHTFDHVLVDFFLVDKILKPGGIVILDDTDWPAIAKVASFIEKNRDYEFLEGTPQRSYLKDNKSSSNFLQKVFGAQETPEKKFAAMAFRKISDDKRTWNHFENFD